jgi:hypothetical protein
MSNAPTQTPYPLTYQEALRSLGALLDAAVAPRASLTVDGQGVVVDAPGGFGTQRYSWAHVVALSEARATLRGRVPGSPIPRLTSWEALLRLAGRALDLTTHTRFELHAAVATPAEPMRCYLEVALEGNRVLGETELIEQLMEIEAIRRSRGWGRESDTSPDD